MGDSTHKENSLQKRILTLQNRIKELEEEPQKLKNAMECERTLRLQAESELIAAKNTASRWKNKCDSSMVKLGVMAERLCKLNNQKKILVKAIEKYRKPAHEKSDGSSNLAAVNDIIDNPEYDKEEAFSDQFKSGPIAIAHESSSNANNENEKQLQNPTDDSQGNQLSTQNVTSTINPQPVRRLSKTNPFAKANEESASGESRERSDPSLNSSNSEKEPSQNSVNAPVPSKAQNTAIRDTRRNTPIFGDEVFVKEATTVNEKSHEIASSNPKRRRSLSKQGEVLLRTASEQSGNLFASVKNVMTAIASASSSGQKKTAKKSIDWGPLGTPSMSRLIQTEICKGRDDNIRFVYNLWGHILDHKPFEEIQKVHPGGIAMSKIAYSSAMTFLDVFLPYMRQQRPDMLFSAQWINSNEKWGNKHGYKMWMEPMSDIAKNKHHLINVRISMEHNEEYLTEEQVKVQSILSGRYDT